MGMNKNLLIPAGVGSVALLAGIAIGMSPEGTKAVQDEARKPTVTKTITTRPKPAPTVTRTTTAPAKPTPTKTVTVPSPTREVVRKVIVPKTPQSCRSALSSAEQITKLITRQLEAIAIGEAGTPQFTARTEMIKQQVIIYNALADECRKS